MMKLDELAWSRVDNDLEDIGDDGLYYGLEELDGVGVETDGGVLKFVPASKQQSETPKKTNTATQAASAKKKKKTRTVKPKEPSASASQEGALGGSADEFNEFGVLGKLEDARTLTCLGTWPKQLDSRIYKGLDKLGFLDPTPIQAQTITKVLEGRDVIGKAATGSGKTLAYSLPLLQRYYSDPDPVSQRPEGLIISPTRELAHQICDHIKAVLPLKDRSKVVALTGGLAIQKQLRQLVTCPAVVVATPGRLLEVMEQMPAKQQREWQKIPSLVLDEADRLVQSGSFVELESVLRIIGVSKQRQVLVYSATFNTELWSSLSSSRKRKREEIRETMEHKFGLSSTADFVDADPESKVAKAVRQAVIECPAMEKDLYLYYFLLLYPGKTIAFVNSIDAVKRLVPLLKEVGIAAVGVHSDMIQKQRLRSIEKFKSLPASPTSVLVATDVAARGLDVPFVDHVVHYHLPRTGDMYIHRSGRTARAGNEGVSLVLSSPQESSGPLPKLVKLIDSKPQHLDVDFDVLAKLRDRIRVAKKIADTQLMATQKGKSQSWLSQAADELGIELDDDFEKSMGGDLRGKKSKQTFTDVPGALQALRSELADLLQQKLRTNRRYLTSGTENLAQRILANPDALVPEKQSRTALEELSTKKKPRSDLSTSTKAPSVPPSSAISKARPLTAAAKSKKKVIKPGSVVKNAKGKTTKKRLTGNARPNGPKGRGRGKTISMAGLGSV